MVVFQLETVYDSKIMADSHFLDVLDFCFWGTRMLLFPKAASVGSLLPMPHGWSNPAPVSVLEATAYFPPLAST